LQSDCSATTHNTTTPGKRFLCGGMSKESDDTEAQRLAKEAFESFRNNELDKAIDIIRKLEPSDPLRVGLTCALFPLVLIRRPAVKTEQLDMFVLQIPLQGSNQVTQYNSYFKWKGRKCGNYSSVFRVGPLVF